MSAPRGLPTTSVPAPADKRFRRADTRPGRKGGGWWRSSLFRWAVALVFVALFILERLIAPII